MPQVSKMSKFYRFPEILDGEMKDLIFAMLLMINLPIYLTYQFFHLMFPRIMII